VRRIEPKSLVHTGTQIVQQNICRGDEAVEDFGASWMLQVERNALFAVQHVDGFESSSPVRVAVERLDLDDACPELGQDRGSQRPCDEVGDLQYRHTVERSS
jgi:hypothetical protein